MRWAQQRRHGIIIGLLAQGLASAAPGDDPAPRSVARALGVGASAVAAGVAARRTPVALDACTAGESYFRELDALHEVQVQRWLTLQAMP